MRLLRLALLSLVALVPAAPAAAPAPLVAATVVVKANGSGESFQVEFYANGVAAKVATIDGQGAQPTYSINGGAAVAIPTPTATTVSSAIYCNLPQSFRAIGTPDPSILRIGVGERQFNHGNTGGADAWVDGGLGTPSYSGHPYTTTQAGDLATWPIDLCSASADTFSIAVTWIADPSLSGAVHFTVIDRANTVLADVAVDQRVAPNDFTESGFGWKTIVASLTNVAGNSRLYVRATCPAGGKAAVDAVRLRRTSSDASIRIGSTDTLDVTIPGTWATVTDGTTSYAVPGGTYRAANCVGDTTLPAIDPATITMGAGFNVEADDPGQVLIASVNLYTRVGLPYAGSVAWDPTTYQPTTLNAQALHGIPVVAAANDAGGKGKGLANAPNGRYKVSWTGPDTYVLEPGPSTDVTEVVGLRTATSRVYDCQAHPQVAYSPRINLGLVSSAAPSNGTYAWSSSAPTIIPPDPADPTGQTVWANPPEYHPAADAKLANAGALRFLDPLGTNNLYIHEFVDVTIRTTLSVKVDRIEPPGVADPWFDPNQWAVAKVTTHTNHGIPDGTFVTLAGCGTATMTGGGPAVDLAGGAIGGGYLAHVVSPTVLYLQVGTGGGSGAIAMANTLTPANGTINAVWGGGPRFGLYVDRCRAAGADFWLNMPRRASDACLVAMAQALADGTTGLPSGKKVWLEECNEHWNFSFEQYYDYRTLAYRLQKDAGTPNPTDLDNTAGYVAEMKRKHAVFIAAWVAAGRSSGDVVRVVGTLGGNPGQVTNALALQLIAQSAPAEMLATGPYFEADFYGTSHSSAWDGMYDAMTVGQSLDWIEYLIQFGGYRHQYLDSHRAVLDAHGLTSIQLCCYEGGLEYITPGLSLSANRERTQAIVTDPRMRRVELGRLKSLQDGGCRMNCQFYAAGGYFFNGPTQIAAYPIYTGWDQVAGVAAQSDPFAADVVQSPRGSAFNQWNAWRLAGGASVPPVRLRDIPPLKHMRPR